MGILLAALPGRRPTDWLQDIFTPAASQGLVLSD
jgi:hypothetical protein